MKLATPEHEAPGEVSQQSSAQVMAALDHILHSTRFKDSQQLQSLLRYVVSEVVNGNEDGLKERMIGIHVFGRRPDYDTTADPIVRSRMGLLRRRLAQYYDGADGEQAHVRIAIPNGTYRPTFLYSQRAAAEHTPVTLSASVEAMDRRFPARPASTTVEDPGTGVLVVEPVKGSPLRVRRWQWAAAILGGLALVVVATVWWSWQRNTQTELDALWAPIVKGKEPVYVYTGSMPVFEKQSPEDEASSVADLYWPIRLPEPPLQDMPQTADHVISYGEGMLTGSVYADIRVAGFLSRYGRTPVLRSGSNLPFMDLKGSPLILIGSFDNYWTRVMNQDLPFYFDRGFGIRERDGTHRRWHNPLKAEMTPRMMDDYALIFRVMDSKAGAPVLAIAGLSTCGTHAAADFVTDSTQMRALAGISRSALKDKNIELVLHTSLVNCAPTSAQIVASKVW